MKQIMVKSSADMDNLISSLGKDRKMFNSYIGRLRSEQVFLNNAWEGKANEEFNNEFTTDIKQFYKFEKLLGEYISTLVEIRKTYEETEHSNARIARERNV